MRNCSAVIKGLAKPLYGPRSRPKVTDRRIADENNAVVTIVGGGCRNRHRPCPECPWRRENAGSFPAEAFRLSAGTAYDASFSTFACHMSGSVKPATCAGFLLRNAQNNIGARLAAMRGDFDPSRLDATGADLFESYRAMAEANGVPADDPVLAPCRADFE